MTRSHSDMKLGSLVNVLEQNPTITISFVLVTDPITKKGERYCEVNPTRLIRMRNG